MESQLTASQLFNNLLQLERELLVLQEDIKMLKSDNTYHQDNNPKGIEKDVVNNVAKAAKAKARETDLLEKIEELQAIDEIIQSANS